MRDNKVVPNLISAGEKVSLSIRIILFKPVVVHPHQSAPQTAFPGAQRNTFQVQREALRQHSFVIFKQITQ
jgi:hypothetical protein